MDQAGGYEQLAPGEVLPWFDERQREAVNALFDFLIPKIRSGAIERIVDLGCGTGEILLELAHQVGQDRRGRAPIEMLGLDCDLGSIREAQDRRQAATLPSEVTCTFAHCEAADNFLSALLQIPGGTTPATQVIAKTAVLCLGHTIFHLPYLPEMFDRLRARSVDCPGLWVIDVYHSWDRVLTELELGTRQIDEPRHLVNSPDGVETLHVLFTRKDNDDLRKVVRGLVSRPAGNTLHETVRTTTKQFNWSTARLIAQFSTAPYVLAYRGPARTGYGDMDRLVFQHRDRSFPLPALFLDSKTVPRRPSFDRGGGTSGTMAVLAQWIHDSGLIGREAGLGFDFVLVEVSPFYNDSDGLRALDQEVLLCAKHNLFRQDAMQAALNGYAHELQGLLSNGLSPFFHPEFAGYCEGDHWAPVHYSLLHPDTPPESSLDSASAHWLETWRRRIDVEEPLNGSPSTTPSSFSIGEIDYLSNSNNLESLARRKIDELKLSHSVRIRNDRKTDKECVEEDLDLLQRLLHDRARHVFAKTVEMSGFKTVLMGIPLRATLDNSSGSSALPDRFRGGVWVFGGFAGEYTAQQNILLGDLARLTVLLQLPAIDAKAASAFTANLTAGTDLADRDPVYVSADESWRAMEKELSENEVLKRWHDVEQWKEAADSRRASFESRFKKLQVRERALRLLNCEHLLENPKFHLPEIHELDALVCLKGVERRALPASVARRILLCGKGEVVSPEIPAGARKCLVPRESKHCGRLARALYELATTGDNNPDLIDVQKSLQCLEDYEGYEVWQVLLEPRFATRRAALEARGKMGRQVAEARKESGRFGRGTLARHVLLQASDDCTGPYYNPFIDMVGDYSFRLEFRFKGVLLP